MFLSWEFTYNTSHNKVGIVKFLPLSFCNVSFSEHLKVNLTLKVLRDIFILDACTWHHFFHTEIRVQICPWYILHLCDGPFLMPLSSRQINRRLLSQAEMFKVPSVNAPPNWSDGASSMPISYNREVSFVCSSSIDHWGLASKVGESPLSVILNVRLCSRNKYIYSLVQKTVLVTIARFHIHEIQLYGVNYFGIFKLFSQ